MPYGQKTISRKCYKGSILFSVLLLFLLCTFLLMAALESYRLSMDLNIRIKNYYILICQIKLDKISSFM